MQSLEPLDHLNRDSPYELLLEVPSCLTSLSLSLVLLLLDALIQIAFVRELHDQTKRVALLVKEGLFVSDDARIFNRSQDADFVKRILLLLVREVRELDLKVR
jgi:hypothetical protein